MKLVFVECPAAYTHELNNYFWSFLAWGLPQQGCGCLEAVGFPMKRGCKKFVDQSDENILMFSELQKQKSGVALSCKAHIKNWPFIPRCSQTPRPLPQSLLDLKQKRTTPIGTGSQYLQGKRYLDDIFHLVKLLGGLLVANVTPFLETPRHG
jgi:hypothetical protein